MMFESSLNTPKIVLSKEDQSTADSYSGSSSTNFEGQNTKVVKSFKGQPNVSGFMEEEIEFRPRNLADSFQRVSQQQDKSGDPMSQVMQEICSSIDFSGKKEMEEERKVDRFIPNRQASKYSIALTSAHDMDENFYQNQYDPQRLKGKDLSQETQVSVLEMYKSHVLGISNKKACSTPIEQEEQQCNSENFNILRFQQNENSNQMFSKNQNQGPLCSLQDMMLNKNGIINKYNPQKQKVRKIPKTPFKVLDAPQLQDDFYLNLIDWSSQNQLAVALASCVYLWSATNNKVIKFCDLGMNDLVTSVQWNPQGTILSVGTSYGEVQIWDAQKLEKISTLKGHTARVGSLAWSSQLLSSGSRDKTILQRDLRVNDSYISKLVGHKQEVCGMKWSFDGQQLATGGNDNKLFLWNIHSNQPVAKLNHHTAAVKALAWSPHQHSLLASGGGTADRTIRFWNTHTHQQLDYIDTGSQVCNLMFSKNVNEIVTTHGYSQNQICIWKYPTLEKVTDLYGHTSRVLFLAGSPEGDTIVTGAGDETLRFWNIFPQKEADRQRSSLLVGDNIMRGLR